MTDPQPSPLAAQALPDGRRVELITLGRAPGPVLVVRTLGAAVHRLEVGGADGARHDVVLSHRVLGDRLTDTGYLGGTIGRYANRIAGGRFSLDGRAVVVRTHDRGHSLHGGPDGFDLRLWEVFEHSADTVLLGLRSPDGDQGFPGELRAQVRYRVRGSAVEVEMTATTDAPTVVNLTNHAYFHLDGEGSGSVEDHVISVAAGRYTPVDAAGIPTGGHADVGGTPFDLRRPTRIGTAIRAPHPQLLAAGGLDHNFVVDGTGLREHARLTGARHGIGLRLLSDQPGLQVYTANAFDGSAIGPSGVAYSSRAGIALEPQLFPDSPHHPEWPSARLDPGQTYRSRLVWQFSTT